MAKITQQKKGFVQGYACALANFIRGYNSTSETLTIPYFLSEKELRKHGVIEDDIQILVPVIQEIVNRNMT